MATPKILDNHKARIDLDLGSSLREVRRRYGKGIVAQLLEIARLALGDGRLTPKEYFYLGLYDDSRFSFAQKKRFIGRWAGLVINHLVNGLEFKTLEEDKVTFAEAFHSGGLPTIEIIAVYNRPVSNNRMRWLNDRAELKAFLQSASYPLFGKPVCGEQSNGCAKILGCAGEELILHPDNRVDLDALIDEIDPWEGGYLFQEVLHPHPIVRQVCGDKIASLRMVVMLDKKEPALVQVAWKVPVGDHIADNTWRDGNLLAPVDIESGVVAPAVRGAGLERQELERHPDTNHAIAGLALPRWDETKRLCLKGATLFPDWKLQGWDVAICEKGPVLQEVTGFGGFNVLQLISGTGQLDDRLRAMVTACDPAWQSQVRRLILQRAWQVARHVVDRKIRVLRRSAA